MEVLQSVAVVMANVLIPGSGVTLNAGFELTKVCFQVAQVLGGMGETAALIKTQRHNVEEDVKEFEYPLKLLKQRVKDHESLSEELQETILTFQSDVTEYGRIVAKFKKKTLLKQLVNRGELDNANAKTKKTAATLYMRLGIESTLESRNHALRFAAELERREKRYMVFVDSPEVTKEMQDVDIQMEILATIKRLEDRMDVTLRSDKGSTRSDPVRSVVKDKLRSGARSRTSRTGTSRKTKLKSTRPNRLTLVVTRRSTLAFVAPVGRTWL